MTSPSLPDAARHLPAQVAAHPQTRNLPVLAALDPLLGALDAGRNAVLVAPPGAGKTTLIPLALLAAGWRGDGRILVLEPRRLAARAAATRMAALLGEVPGGLVGFRTRIDAAVSDATRIEVITEGLLVRRLQSDSGLDGVAAVLLDEVHERALEADLALALLLDLQRGLRPELRLLAMSATADGARLATLMAAEVIESAGRQYPVTVSHAARDITGPRDLPDTMARAIRAALPAHDGDILAFLPGMADIRRTAGLLDGCGALVLPLHGDLPPAEQDRALRPAEDQRRVVLATSIAETSLTVPGVRIVIDGGFRRAPRLDPSTGLTRLTTLRISRAAAEQRAGRAGREAPGVAIRLWSAALHRGLPAFDRPEILEAELSSLVLDCAAWGAAPADLPFPDPPPAGAVAAGRALLGELGALDADGALTWAGRAMARLGAHPRLSAMMLQAADPPAQALACDLAALLEERDPLRAPDASVDISTRLALLSGAASDANAHRGALASIRRAAGQYRRRLGVPRDAEAAGAPGDLLAAAFPDRIAQPRGEPGAWRLSGGGGAKLSRADPLASARLLVVAALETKAAARITLAAALVPDALPAHLLARATEQQETSLDPATGGVLARRRVRLGALVLRDRVEPAAPEVAADMLAQTIARQALRPLDWTDAARQFQARVALMRRLEPEGGWPDLSDAHLTATAPEWLAAALYGRTRLADAATLDLHATLRAMLPHDRAARLDRDLPRELDLPGGRALMDYAADIPTAAARAQAFYGLADTPRLAGGRITPRLSLLSPASRPIAATADLAGFWAGAWADARRDMRGRYPKHDWPENPAESSSCGKRHGKPSAS
jgi:ATP-dependent helicase HrpB